MQALTIDADSIPRKSEKGGEGERFFLIIEQIDESDI
jgi:hypothetical protein